MKNNIDEQESTPVTENKILTEKIKGRTSQKQYHVREKKVTANPAEGKEVSPTDNEPAGKAPRKPANEQGARGPRNTANETRAKAPRNTASEPEAKGPRNTANAQGARGPRNTPNTQKVQETKSAVVESIQGEGTPTPQAGSRRNRGNANSRGNRGKGSDKDKVRIIPLGGIEEIGKNMTAIEYGEEIIVIDCGLKFPEDEMLGIDIVIPDVNYLIKNKDKVKGFFITHGHEDHIGALPYILKQFNVPVYATRFTQGLIENKLREHHLFDIVKLNTVKHRDVFKFAKLSVEFIKMTHSIPDASSIVIHTPLGAVVHTGDFKIDFTPVDGKVTDLARFAELGESGVLALMADSTNAENQGHTVSESTVGGNLERIFRKARGRILVATFSSNIHRIQQIASAAILLGKKCAFSGRSIENVVGVARELGYLNIEDKHIIGIDEVSRFRDDQVCIMTTGSQGEPMSALTRMSMGEHRKIQIKPGDMVILSSHPIPGNEKSVSKTINLLFKMGAEVIYDAMEDVHVSGHACQEELKLIHSLVKPKYFIPVHGEYRMLKVHAELARKMGMDPKNILIPENGVVMELSEKEIRRNGIVPSGQVLVDGLGVGDVGNIVLRDRQHLAMDGIITVVATVDSENGTLIAGPDIISRGFIFVKEAEGLMDGIKDIARDIMDKNEGSNMKNTEYVKNLIKEQLKNFLWQRTMRKPMIVPIIMEI